MVYSSIPIPILFTITVFAVVCANTIRASYVKKIKPSDSAVFLFNGTISIISLFVFLVLAGFNIEVSNLTFVLASIYGIMVMISMVCNTLALKVGPYSYTTVITSLSTVITALSGWLFWNEKLSILKVFGLIFMIACFFFAVDKKGDKKTVSVKWFLLCMVCLVTGATLGLIQKAHQNSSFKNELNGFLIVAFSMSICFSFVSALILKRKEKLKEQPNQEKQKKQIVKYFILSSIVIGVGVAVNNVLNLYLAGAVNSSVMFPIVNGVPFVMAVLISFLFFKEKLTKRQTFGVVLGIVSMIFLCV